MNSSTVDDDAFTDYTDEEVEELLKYMSEHQEIPEDWILKGESEYANH